MRYFVSFSLEIFYLETGEKSVSVVTSPLAVTRPGRAGEAVILSSIFSTMFNSP